MAIVAHVHQISISDGGVPKRPVAQAMVSILGVEGDRQRSPKIHGGVDRAVCLYSLEVIEELGREGHSIAPGVAGENLTLAGLRWDELVPGDHMWIGESVELEIASYTTPCHYNAQWFRDGQYRRMSQKHYPGWSRLYARVLREGLVRVGDTVIVEKKVKVK